MEQFDLKKDLKVDPSDLDNEFLRQPELTEHYGRIAVEAQFVYEDAKTAYDVLFAQMVDQKRADYEISGQKISKPILEHLALRDEGVQSLKADARRSKKAWELAKVAFKAIDQRMSVLISVGAKERKMMDAGAGLHLNTPEHSRGRKHGNYTQGHVHNETVRVKSSIHDMVGKTPSFGRKTPG